MHFLTKVVLLFSALVATAAWVGCLIVFVSQYSAAHGQYNGTCLGYSHVDRFLGLCTDFEVSGCAIPLHYCSGPLTTAELASIMHASFPCYSATPFADCPDRVVLSRKNDAVG